jgi:hypothetical protein
MGVRAEGGLMAYTLAPLKNQRFGAVIICVLTGHIDRSMA